MFYSKAEEQTAGYERISDQHSVILLGHVQNSKGLLWNR
jgi:hypothetical protein